MSTNSPATRAKRALAKIRTELIDAPHRIGYEAGPRLMSGLRKRWVLLRHPRANIVFGSDVYLGPGFSLHIPGKGSFIVGSGVEFRRGFRAEIYHGGTVEIGDDSYLTYDVILACSTSIEIGKRCGLAQATFVADGSHRYKDLDRTFLAQGYDNRPILIADDAQIHSKCTIVNSIGARSVIGANAVVSRPIPPYCMAAGVPARVLDYFGPEGSEPEGWEPVPGSGESPASSQASR